MTTECVHHDKIATPNGPIAKGKCLKCGRIKEYETTYGYQYNNKPLSRPSTTSLGRKLKRDWSEPLEWKEQVWCG